MSQYKAYPKYKDSGIEWIGQVPEHWAIRKVAWDMHMAIGWTPSTDNGRFYGGQHNWVTIADLSSGRITETKTKITDEAIKARGAVPAPIGSVLFSYKLTIGAVALLDEPAYTNEAIVAFHPSSKVVMRWWFYAAPNILLQNAIENIYGAKLLNQEIMASSRFYAPTIKEQTAIAATLDRETARIDALIEKKTRFIELLKEKRQALITHAVTKGLDPNVKMKDSGIEWIGQVPEEWLNRKVFHAFQTIGSGTTPPSKEHEWYQGGTIPWITTSELRENTVVKTKKCVTSDAIQKFSALKIFPAGSLAIAMYGATIGRLGFLGIPATTNQACCVLSGERDLNVQFLYYWLMAFRAYIVAFFSEGGGQPNINQEVIASLRVPSPVPDEQANIVATLDRETARIDTLVEKTKQSITLLKERRAAFITAAVTGRIDLRGEY